MKKDLSKAAAVCDRPLKGFNYYTKIDFLALQERKGDTKKYDYGDA
jgi:hypothetical protein